MNDFISEGLITFGVYSIAGGVQTVRAEILSELSVLPMMGATFVVLGHALYHAMRRVRGLGAAVKAAIGVLWLLLMFEGFVVADTAESIVGVLFVGVQWCTAGVILGLLQYIEKVAGERM